MRLRNICVILFLFIMDGHYSYGQSAPKQDTAFVNKLLQESKSRIADDAPLAIKKAMEAKTIAAKINFPIGEANALKNLGLVSSQKGDYVEALDYWEQSLRIFKEQKDKIGIANLLNNIGSIYSNQGDDAKALEYCLKSLKIAEETGDKLRIMSALVNVGSIYYNKKDPKASSYLSKALPLCEEMGNKAAYGIIAGNIGEIYFDEGKHDKALEFFNLAIKADPNSSSAAFAYTGMAKINLKKSDYNLALQNNDLAMAIAIKLGDKMQQMRALRGTANIYVAQNDHRKAIDYYNQARVLGEELKANVELKDIYQEISVAYTKAGDYPNALLYKTNYADIKDTLYNIETAKKLNTLQFEFDLSKKEDKIKILTNEQKLSAVELKRQRQAKVALLIGILLLLVIAFTLYRNYRIKVKTNKILDKQNVEIENLLLNILPAEVAKELRVNGKAIPRSYEKVSVLFSDFKGFTSVAKNMSPEELVEELNTCFVAFDNIIEKHGLEKIKTIGDSYMCAGGIPIVDISHPFRMVKAALEIQEYMKGYNEKRSELQLPPLEMRIGIHVGPVVAGVVGKKKYAFDIWGSTVNIASRMESNGEPGKVNITAETYEMIKEKYICSYRGKLYAKNYGEVDMYFVQQEINSPEATPPLAKVVEPKDGMVYTN